MAYNSKYTGAQVDALLDKINNNNFGSQIFASSSSTEANCGINYGNNKLYLYGTSGTDRGLYDNVFGHVLKSTSKGYTATLSQAFFRPMHKTGN